MKVAVILDTPLLESFALIGADYLYDKLQENIDDDVGLMIVKKDLEKKLTMKYPNKIIIGCRCLIQ